MSVQLVYSILVSSLCTQLSVSDGAGVIPAFGFGLGMGFGGVGRNHQPTAYSRTAVYAQKQPQEINEETAEGNEEIVKNIPEFGEENIEETEEIPEEIGDGTPLEEFVGDEEIPVEEPIVDEDIPDDIEEIPEEIGEPPIVQPPVDCELCELSGLNPLGGIAKILILKHTKSKPSEFKNIPDTDLKSEDINQETKISSD
ncbi:hypothetical protein O3M35_000885 [Rhynocoris fuscipes]|uniref:Uncharacterized protein n=1 Tax=Rhynocoris fuscipes TaxID=488301 RepID=A0AAW1DTI0_9HEMI